MKWPMLFLGPLVVLALFAGLAGCRPGQKASGSGSSSSSSGSSTAGRYEVTVDGGGFHPGQLALAVGEPATIVVTRTTDQTCATEMVIPSLSMRKALPLNQPVEFAVTPTEKGQISFACGMNMMTGVIDVR